MSMEGINLMIFFLSTDVMSGNIDEKSMMTYVASLFELTPKEDDIEQKLYCFKEQFSDLFTQLHSAIDELNSDSESKDCSIDLSQNRLENNYYTLSKQFDSFKYLFEEIEVTFYVHDGKKPISILINLIENQILFQ